MARASIAGMTAGLINDLRYALRQLGRTKIFTIPAIAGLALGIGATTSVFSVVHAMLLNSMGFSDAGRLITLWQTEPQRGQKHVEVCYTDLVEWRKQTALLEGVALASSVNLDFPLLGDGEPQQVDGVTVSGEFFRVLGSTPAIGRFFEDADDQPGAPLRLVISNRLWRSRYGADPGIVGRQIRAGDGTATVIGVTRPEFDFPRDVDLWVPLRASWPTVEQQPRFRVFRSVARLQPGVSVEAAQTRLNVVARQIDATLPAGSTPYNVLVTPLIDEIFGPARRAVWLLGGAVVLVLLIACANVANLLMARATVRSRELAIRAVLGAGKERLVRLLLSESVLLATVAGVAGLIVAAFGVAALVRLAPRDVPRIGLAEVNLPVLLFGAAVSIATVLVFGLAPAWIASRRDYGEALKQSGRSTSPDRSHVRLRRALLAGQVGLSILLLVGAGLLVRSFGAMAGVDPGFQPERVLTFRITTATGSQEKRREIYSQILDRVRALPGVTSAAAILIRPLSGIVGWDTLYMIDGQSPEEQLANPNGNYEAISPDYFRTMGIRVNAGRDFTSTDTHTAPGVVIVNESTARRHWGGRNPVGQRLRLGRDSKAPWLTVVGVVSDVRYREWEAARPDFYIPYTQRAQHRSDFVVKTHGDPSSLVAAVRNEVFAVDKNQPVSNVTTMEALVDSALARSRFNGVVLTVLALCALALAAIGIYGVMSYTVAQRTGEIGVRLAVGATPERIVRLITSSGMAPTLLGAGLGLIAAAALGRVVSALLFHVSPWDPLTYAGAILVLLAIAAMACLIPALRAATLDPVRALQSE